MERKKIIGNRVQIIGLYFLYPYTRTAVRVNETDMMKGYAVESGYMGYVDGEYMLFASETDYTDYMEQ